MTGTGIPSLSIVIPVYNEAEWIRRSVADVVRAVRNSPFAADAELVIVDDGSNRATKEALASLPHALPTRLLTQENLGRFAARAAGIEAARGDLVFLLDSRVFMAPDSLQFVGERLNGDRLPAWNGHVEIDVERNPFARFWRTVTFAGWRDYLANPRTTSFGLAEFDRYPKGTGCFIAPREALLRALGEFRSVYGGDLRFASDDTVLIRSIAAEQPINISPGFASRYSFPKSWRRFLRHAYYRGTTFVDSFGRPGTRFFPVVVGFFPASVLFAGIAVKRPRLALALIGTGPLAAAAGAAALRRPRADVLSFSALIVPFGLAYSAGIWRGGLLAARARGDR